MIAPILCTGWPPRVPPVCACGVPRLWQAETVTEELKTFVWVCPNPHCPVAAQEANAA